MAQVWASFGLLYAAYLLIKAIGYTPKGAIWVDTPLMVGALGCFILGVCGLVRAAF